MSYGKKRLARYGNRNPFGRGANVDATAFMNYEDMVAKRKKKCYGSRVNIIAEYIGKGFTREEIDKIIGKPCSDWDWKSAKECLKQIQNNKKIPEENYEQRKKNQKEYMAKILDCVIRSKDYDLKNY